ncbi:hypothetical protein lerEdw1_001060 [Lerista edwardsae]|nr:hypothetical protein lerEdw1_001060 [Lerista edwardsae]
MGQPVKKKPQPVRKTSLDSSSSSYYSSSASASCSSCISSSSYVERGVSCIPLAADGGPHDVDARQNLRSEYLSDIGVGGPVERKAGGRGARLTHLEDILNLGAPPRVLRLCWLVGPPCSGGGPGSEVAHSSELTPSFNCVLQDLCGSYSSPDPEEAERSRETCRSLCELASSLPHVRDLCGSYSSPDPEEAERSRETCRSLCELANSSPQ